MVELVLRVTLSLGVVLGLFWLVARFSARRLGGGTRSPVRVIGRQALGRNASLAVVEIGDRVLVVGVGDNGVRLLVEMDPSELEQPADDPSAAGEPAIRLVGRRRSPDSAVSGSLVSMQTWRQAWAAATNRNGTG